MTRWLVDTPIFLPSGNLDLPSGDLELDHQLAAELMDDLHYAVSPAPGVEEYSGAANTIGSIASASSLNSLFTHCYGRGGRVNVNGSYLVGPEGGTRYRAYWAMGYSIYVHCDVGAIRDRAKVGPSANGQVRWQGSIVGDDTSQRGIVLYEDWTPVYQVTDYAQLGERYINLGRKAGCSSFFCTDYSGYIPLENPF